MLEKLLDADFDHQVVAKFFMRDVKLVTTKFLVAFSVLCVHGISIRSVVSGTFATGMFYGVVFACSLESTRPGLYSSRLHSPQWCGVGPTNIFKVRPSIAPPNMVSTPEDRLRRDSNAQPHLTTKQLYCSL